VLQINTALELNGLLSLSCLCLVHRLLLDSSVLTGENTSSGSDSLPPLSSRSSTAYLSLSVSASRRSSHIGRVFCS